MQRDGGLAVGLLAQRPAVLTLHAHRMRTGFGESRIIEHENTGRVREGLCQQRAVATGHRPLVPGTLADELLQALVRVLRASQGGGQAHAAAQRLDALALAILQQPGRIHPAPGPLARGGLKSSAKCAAYASKRRKVRASSSGVKVLFMADAMNHPPTTLVKN